MCFPLVERIRAVLSLPRRLPGAHPLQPGGHPVHAPADPPRAAGAAERARARDRRGGRPILVLPLLLYLPPHRVAPVAPDAPDDDGAGDGDRKRLPTAPVLGPLRRGIPPSLLCVLAGETRKSLQNLLRPGCSCFNQGFSVATTQIDFPFVSYARGAIPSIVDWADCNYTVARPNDATTNSSTTCRQFPRRQI